MTRRLHLITGLILFGYLLVHLVNHATLVVSIGTADAMLRAIHPWLVSAPITALLLDALVLHVALALLALWRRRTLRFTGYEALQYLLGFCLPLLLLPHVAGTRVQDSLFDAAWGYYRNLLVVFWQLDPWQGFSQAALLLAGWTHACIGLRFWLRLKPWFPAWAPLLGVLAIMLPLLGLAGMVAAGNEVSLRLASDPHYLARILADRPPPEALAAAASGANRMRLGLVLAVLAVLLARGVRFLLRRRAGQVRISYPDGRAITVPAGWTVLEASWLLGYPHASVCGGRGRCSTCRVSVHAAAGALPPPGPEETRVLARVGAPADIRLACQLRPTGPVQVAPLLDAALPASALLRFRAPRLLGEERSVVIAFVDLRDFTRMSETRLPFDVVHLLNRYFRAMGEAVEEAGGVVDKFIGDGVMALFGTEGPPDEAAACRAAMVAAQAMSLKLAALNQAMAAELGETLRIGIGMHLGPVILGMLGHGRTVGLTAIGDAVNTASRLEAACKQYGAELVVSEAVLATAGLDLAGAPHQLAVRGRRAVLPIRAFASAAGLQPGV
jgi:adenylate cyclase